MLGVAVAILAFGLLRTVLDAWYAGVNASSANRLVSRNAISLVFMLPLSYKEKIRQMPGVKQVSYGNWFGGVYIDEKNFIPNFVIDPSTYFDLYPEIDVPEDEKSAFIRDRKGCVAGRKVAERYGWKIGDQISLKGTIFTGNWDMVIRAIYKGKDKTIDESQLFFHWDCLNEYLKKRMPTEADQVGFYMIGLTDPDRASEVALAIDSMFRNSMAETLTETERAFQMGFVQMTEAIVIAIRFVSFVVIVIIMAVSANTMAMNARDRQGEYAVLKTLGFGAGHIAALIFGESLFISMTGCAAGIAATFPAARVFGDELSAFFPIFNVRPETVWLDIAAASAVGVVAAVGPTVRAVRVPIADALRRIV